MVDKVYAPALVTGAAGFVGNNLVRHLLELNRPVRVLVRHAENPSLQGLKVETIVGDVLQPASLRSAIAGVSTVFHLASVISIDGGQDSQMRKVNVEGTANVVEACLKAKVNRLVHFSSIHALSSFPKDQPIDESRELATDPHRHLAYDHSKAAGEMEIMAGIEKGLNAVILNPVGIFGPHDYGPSASGEFILQLMQRKLPALVQAGYYWVDVRDVARAAVAADGRGEVGKKYILCGEHADFRTIAQWIGLCCGVRPPMWTVPVWLARLAAPMVTSYSKFRGQRPLVTSESIEIVTCHQNISTNRAAKELGFCARPLERTIADTVDWLQSMIQQQRTANHVSLP